MKFIQGSSDMELILARVLPKLKTVTNFKVVLLSATLNKDEFLQRSPRSWTGGEVYPK